MSWNNLKWDDRTFIRGEMSKQTSRLIDEMRDQEIRAERRQELRVLLTKAEDYLDRYHIEGNPRLLDLANDYAERAAALAESWEKEALRDSRRAGCVLWLLVLFLGWFFLPASLWLYPLFFLWWLKNYVIFRSRYWPKKEKVTTHSAMTTAVESAVTSSSSAPNSLRYVKKKRGRLSDHKGPAIPLDSLRFGETVPHRLREKMEQVEQAQQAWVAQADKLVEQAGRTGAIDLKDVLEVQDTGEGLLLQLADEMREWEALPDSELNREIISHYKDLAKHLEEALTALKESRTASPEQQAVENRVVALEEERQAWMSQLQEQAEQSESTGRIELQVMLEAQEQGETLCQAYRDLLVSLQQLPASEENSQLSADVITVTAQLEDLLVSLQEVIASTKTAD